MMISITLSVFLRRTDYALAWKLEVSEYILLLSTFFATGWLLRSGGHVSVDMFPLLFKGKKRLKEIYYGLIYTLVALICLVLTINGVMTTWEAFVAGTLQVKVYTFPKWILLSIIPFGFFILFVESSRIVYNFFSGKTSNEDTV
jgi:TRAP-type C4-dicarboxylate transport system permease small subunit